MEDVAAGKLLVDGGLRHLRHADGAEVVEGGQLFAGGRGMMENYSKGLIFRKKRAKNRYFFSLKAGQKRAKLEIF